MFYPYEPFRRNKYFPQDPMFPPLPQVHWNGLVAFWPLENNYNDVTGNGFHLTPYGNNTGFVSTSIGNAFRIRHTANNQTINGSYAYVNDLPTIFNGWDNSLAFTFVFWVVPDGSNINFSPFSSTYRFPLGSIGNSPSNYSSPFPELTDDSDQYNTVGSFMLALGPKNYYNSGHYIPEYSHGLICFLRHSNTLMGYPFWSNRSDYTRRNIGYSSQYAMISISYFDTIGQAGSNLTEYYNTNVRAVETYVYFHPPHYYLTKQISPFYSLSFFTEDNDPRNFASDYFEFQNWTRFYLGLYSQWNASSYYFGYNIAVKHVGLWYRRLARHELDYLYYCQAQRLPF